MRIKTVQNIIERILDSTDGAFHFRNSVFLTYTANLEFFEDMVLWDLLRQGCDNNLILMDGGRYRRTFETTRPTGVGKDYACSIMRTSSTFHPKVVFLSSAQGAALFVGSGNLTQAGYSQNQEVFWEIRYDVGVDKSVPQPIVAAIQMLDAVARRSGSVANSRWGSLLADSQWVAKLLKKTPSIDRINGSLLCSSDGAILDQVLAFLKETGSKVQSITVVSPFFDDKLEVLKQIVQKTRCKEITLLICQGHNNLPDTDAALAAKGARLSIKEFMNDGGRPLHAKFLLMKTSKGSLLLSGSANFSKPALCSGFEPGNFEVCIMQFDKRSDAFDDLLKDRVGKDLVQSEIVRAENIDHVPLEKFEAIILESILMSDGRLFVTLDRPLRKPDDASLRISIPAPATVLPFEWKKPTEAIVRLSALPPDAYAQLTSGAAAVKFVAERSGGLTDLSPPSWVLHEGLIRRQANSDLAKLGQQLFSEDATRALTNYYLWIQRLDSTLNVAENEMGKRARVLEETESEESEVEVAEQPITKPDIYVYENFSPQELQDIALKSLPRHDSVFDFFSLLRTIALEDESSFTPDEGSLPESEESEAVPFADRQKRRLANKFHKFVSSYKERKALTAIDYSEMLKLLGLAFVGLNTRVLEAEEFLDLSDALLQRIFVHSDESDFMVSLRSGAIKSTQSEIERRFLQGPFLPNVLLFLNFGLFVYNRTQFRLTDAVRRYESHEKILSSIVSFWRSCAPTKAVDEADIARTAERFGNYGDFELDETRFVTAARDLLESKHDETGGGFGPKERALRCRAMALTSVIDDKKRHCDFLRKEIKALGTGLLDRVGRLRMEQELAGADSELIDLQKASSEISDDVLRRLSDDSGFVILSCK